MAEMSLHASDTETRRPTRPVDGVAAAAAAAGAGDSDGGRVALMTAIAVGAWMAAGLASGAALNLAGVSYIGDPLAVAALLVTAAAPGAAVWAATPRLHGRASRTLIQGPRAKFWRDAALGGAAAAAATAAAAGAAATIGWVDFSLAAVAVSPWAVAALALLIPAQAASEEIVFRGYFLQEAARRSRNPLAWAVLPSAVFAALHVNPSAPALIAAAGVVGAFAFGLFSAALVRATGGLAASIGFHTLHNWVALLLFQPRGGAPGVGPIAVSPVSDAALAGAALLGAAALPPLYLMIARWVAAGRRRPAGASPP